MARFTLVFRTLTNGLVLGEALGSSELSAVGSLETSVRDGLEGRLGTVLGREMGRHPLIIHRRLAEVRDPVVKRLEMTVEPPARSLAWQEPLTLSFDCILWQETHRSAPFQGCVPGAGVHVVGPSQDQVEKNIIAHLRLALLSGEVSLKNLADHQTTEKTTLGGVAVEPKAKTPRQLAEEKSGKKDAPSVLEKVAQLWTAAALEPGWELDEPLRLVAETLGGEEPQSVLLVGPPGVGKTALVRELARRMTDHGLAGRPLWSTSGSRLIAGQSGFGMWQERCRDLIREALRTRAILHLGSLWELTEVGKYSGNSESIAAFLRPALARGELLAIAECTPEQLAVIERQEPHLAAVFHPIHLREPQPEVTRRILDHAFRRSMERALRRWRERAATPEGSAPALDLLHRLHLRYATYSANPGRPLRFLHMLLRDRTTQNLSCAEVTAAFTQETGLPAVLLDDEQYLDPAEVRAWISERVLGQSAAVEAMVDVLAAIKARLTRPRQPLASLLLIGPTGTGKTELAKGVAQYLFGNANRLARFDLNEFSDPLSVQRLIGGPAGGSGEGLLTARAREHPFSVFLFDEFEKADPAFFDLLLQILGDGRLTDASGRVGDFCNAVIIMTSNLGAREFQRGPLGFASSDGDAESGDAGGHHFAAAVRDFLRPEIYNRIGGIIPFHPLTRDLALRVLRRHLALLRNRDGLRLREIEMKHDDGVEDWLLKEGFHQKYGARPLKRALERDLMTPVAEAINARSQVRRAEVRTSVEKDHLSVSVKAAPALAGDRLPEELCASLAGAAVEWRRKVDALRKGSAVSALEDEISRLQYVERRIKKKEAAQKALLESEILAQHRLFTLRAALARADHLVEIAERWEDDSCESLYQRQLIHDAASGVRFKEHYTEERELRIDILRLGAAEPDRITMMLIGEHHDWVRKLAEIYHSFAQTVSAVLTGLDYLTPPHSRGGASLCVREPAKALAPFMHEAPPHWVGLILQFKGDLILPRLEGEQGLHKLLEEGKISLCQVTVFPGSEFKNLAPPQDAHRSGFVNLKSALLRRIFDRVEANITDSLEGESPWPRRSEVHAVHRLLNARFERLLEDLSV